MKEHSQETLALTGFQANGAAENSVEQSPEARGLSQTMRDPARRKRNASGKSKERDRLPVRQAGANGAARELSSPNGAPNGAEANGKRNGREFSDTGLAASDDASGTTFAGDAAPPYAAVCIGREACAEVAEPGPNDGANHDEGGSVDDRRPRAPGDSQVAKEIVKEQKETSRKVVPGIGDPLAFDAPGFVDEMHARANLYEIGKEFLETTDMKLKQRTWEYLLEMKYGKGAPTQAEEAPRIDFGDLPRPKR